MTLLLKEWMIENQRVSQMEKAHVLSEVEQLKEQVSPELLFKTLHHSGELTLTEPEKASKMLMKLSQLLRYQLYDCSRQKVLLSSEIAFLTNYLTLGRGGKQECGSSSALHSFCGAFHGVDARTANLASCLSGHSSESGEGYDCIHLYVSAT